MEVLFKLGNWIFNITAVTTLVLLFFSYLALSQTIRDIRRIVDKDDNNALIGIKFVIGINVIMYAAVLWRYFW